MHDACRRTAKMQPILVWVMFALLVGPIHSGRAMSNETARRAFESDRNETLTTGHSTYRRDSVASWFSVGSDTFLSSSSVLYGLSAQSSPDQVSRTCHDQLQTIFDGIHRRDVWAMKSKRIFVFVY